MKKSIRLFLTMAFVLTIGAIQVNCQTNKFDKQDLSKNHLEQILNRYDLEYDDEYNRDEKLFVIQIDSIISTNPFNEPEMAKEIKTYYENGNLHTITYLLLINNQWEYTSRFIYSYNADNKVDIRLSESWENNQWSNASKVTYNYTSVGNTQSRLNEMFENEVWVNYRLGSYEYDSNDNFIEYLSQYWEEDEWQNFFILNSTNNENGLWIIDVYRTWEDNAWLKFDSTITDYDDYGNHIFFDRKTWVESEWVNQSYRSYFYDSEQRQTSVTWLNWEEDEYMKWKMDSLTYNEFSLEESMLTFAANESNEWVYSEIEEKVYDGNLNLIEEVIQLWENEQWNNGFFADYLFEEGLITGVMYEWIDNGWETSTQTNRVLSYILSGEEIHRSYVENSNQVYYSDVEVRITKPSDIINQIEAYPNPTNGMYYIKAKNDERIEKVSVFQLNSQHIGTYQLNGDSEFRLDLRNEPNGIYFIKVQTNNYITVLKTIKTN
ncbi:MAG: T9SS type A sorting domain-containing protein [Bacteroidales bacterium]|nr:T9SS type A sorting domain-containing protein [Bacteroidales bacterium]